VRSRTPRLAVVAGLSVALLAGACSASGGSADTVTSRVTVRPSTGSVSSAPGSAGVSSPASVDGNGKPAAVSSVAGKPPVSGATSGRPGTSKPPGSAASSSAGKQSTSTNAPGGTGDYAHPQDGVALPDGFVPKKLTAGQKPPQFIVVSFDGVGWNEKWQYWFDIAKKVPFRFTGFLSGTYMLSAQTRTQYTGPGHKPGASDINWNNPEDLPVEINDLNRAVDSGIEIGTHFNGHFCGPGGGSTWSQADWNTELDQFFALIKNYKTNNPGAALPDLKVTKDDIKGERTPCLEGKEEALFPALVKHGMTYDSSFTKRGISWPKKSQQNNIWQIGMAEFPMHGTITGNTELPPEKRVQHMQITMDYNFYYSQEQAGTKGMPSPDQSKIDSQQVVDTYNDMYDATFNGNRAPLILGNHFNQWNNNAYSDAIGKFVLETCGKPDTQCVPFRDLIAWMQVQDPARLAQLQAQKPEMGKTAGN